MNDGHRPALWTGKTGKRSVQAVANPANTKADIVPAPSVEAAHVTAEQPTVEPAPEPASEPQETAAAITIEATDAARALAAEHGIDLSSVTPTGERITKADVAALAGDSAT